MEFRPCVGGNLARMRVLFLDKRGNQNLVVSREVRRSLKPRQQVWADRGLGFLSRPTPRVGIFTERRGKTFPLQENAGRVILSA